MIRWLIICLVLSIFNLEVEAQCFASAGNPIGGTANMGVMDKNALRTAVFYKFAYSGKYHQGNRNYTGQGAVLNYAWYNYSGWLVAYGISDKLTIETEGGYFINKSQNYEINNSTLSGNGLSNAVVSIKPRLFYNPDKRVEISCALGANIPFSLEPQIKDGVRLPIDIQPSTGSFGIVFQSFFIKENSFNAIRFLLTNRIEKYFLNNQDYLFGNLYSTSFYFSRHFIFNQLKLKDWTLILQLKNQIKDKNYREGNIVTASGSFLLFLGPQINLALNNKWNISLLGEIPLYQNYNDIQLANNYAFVFSLVRDFQLNKAEK